MIPLPRSLSFLASDSLGGKYWFSEQNVLVLNVGVIVYIFPMKMGTYICDKNALMMFHIYTICVDMA